MLWMGILFIGLTVANAFQQPHAECQHAGLLLANGTIWYPEPCLKCQCFSSITVCTNVQCDLVTCDKEGYELVSLPHECCPRCQPKLLSCFEEGKEIMHGRKWFPIPCLECQCHNGSVSCGHQYCPLLECPEGQVPTLGEGECCPKCMSNGESCKVGDKIYNDSSIWSKSSCSRCQCQDGVKQCYIEQCSTVPCPANHTLELSPGDCCPKCQGRRCLFNGKTHQSGENWQEDDCTHCLCESGHTKCHKTQCPEVTCRDPYRLYKPPNQCCEECVPQKGWCNYDGKKVPDGSSLFYPKSGCVGPSKEICSCKNSQVHCHIVKCDEVTCAVGQQLIETIDSCSCPKCVPNLDMCYYEGRHLKEGERWISGCSLCECHKGRVVCLPVVCPTCAKDYYPVYKHQALSTSHRSCCPTCEKLHCPRQCGHCIGVPKSLSGYLLTIDNDYSVLCTWCRKGYFLQDGDCVESCTSDRFAKSGQCLSCHPTCQTCTERTQFHCKSCKYPLLLHGGQCFERCPKGYFAGEQSCQKCHSFCQECSGLSSNECLSCQPHFVQLEGSCLNECPKGHKDVRGSCVSCPDNCLNCGINECLQCSDGFFNQNGTCLSKCEKGYYPNGKDCTACAPLCDECYGSSPLHCSQCIVPYVKVASKCLISCPKGTYLQKRHCLPCHKSCSRCIDGGLNSCLDCNEESQLILVNRNPITPSSHDVDEDNFLNSMYGIRSGKCVDDCPLQYQKYLHYCIAPPQHCEEWSPKDSGTCKKCAEGFQLQNATCVDHCSDGFYQSRNGSNCYECDPHCLTCTGPGNELCSSCHRWGSLHTRALKGSIGTSSRCLTKCRERHYVSPEDLSCRRCPETCRECAVRGKSYEIQCSKCAKKSHHIEGRKCVEKCSEGFYLQSDTNICLPCHQTCRSCSGPNIEDCKTCFSDQFLTIEGTCEQSKCKDFDMNCTECREGCRQCGKSKGCLKCHIGFVLHQKQCIASCPSNFYETMHRECASCHENCTACYGPTSNDCLNCRNDNVMFKSNCIKNCPQGSFNESGICIACMRGCVECTSVNSCTSCQQPYLLEKNTCVLKCSEGWFNNWDTVCLECGPHCKKCSTFGCDTCKQPYWKENGNCVKQCSRNYYKNKEKQECHFNMNPPNLFVSGSLVVERGSYSVINSSLLQIFDPETSPELLSVILVSSPSNGNFYIHHNNKKQMKLVHQGDSVTLEELSHGRLLFKHTTESASADLAMIKVSDGQMESDTLPLSINVVSPFPLTIDRLEPLIIRRGSKGFLSSEHIQIGDVDNSGEIYVRVLESFQYGKLLLHGKSTNKFSLGDLDELLITYEYTSEDSDFLPMEDTSLLQATDGQNAVNFEFTVKFTDPERPAPVVINNKGAIVNSNDRVQITRDLLEARDIDSKDENIIFSLERNNYTEGQIVLVIQLPQTTNPRLDDTWIQMDESHLLKPTLSFTQQDVNEGRVWYIYNPESKSGHKKSSAGASKIKEELLFTVSDSSDPPNVLADQTFIIQVETPFPKETEAVRLAPGAMLGLTVLEGQAVTLTPNHLSFLGMGSDDHLVYTITRPLGPLDGFLFHIDSPGLELQQFTQSDINDMKIIYVPPLEDARGIEKDISFKFTISNAMEGKPVGIDEQKFHIKVLPLKKNLLSFLNPDPELVVLPMQSIEIPRDYFLLDQTFNGDVSIFLLEPPTAGTLNIQSLHDPSLKENFSEETEITLGKIEESRVFYMNRQLSSIDSATFLVVTHNAEATTKMTFLMEPNRKPGTEKLFILQVREGDTKTLSLGMLQSENYSNSKVVYTLAQAPMLGSLVFTDPSGLRRELNRTHKFSQNDLANGHLSFVADKEVGLETIEEKILFNLTNEDNSVLPNQAFYIEIEPLDDKSPTLELLQKLEVKEGGIAALTESHIKLADVDSPKEKLKLVLEVPPIFGFLSLDSSGIHAPGSENAINLRRPEIYMSDLLSGSITYIQSQNEHKEPIEDSFMLHATDGINDSPSVTVDISIKPTDDESPVVLGEVMIVEKGKTKFIHNNSLYISDADTQPENLLITIEKLPRHGTLHRRDSVKSTMKESHMIEKGSHFTFQDVNDELIFYSHDGSKDTEDYMEVSVTDGFQETGGFVQFQISPPEMTIPKLLHNTALTVLKGQSNIIRDSDLMASDDYSDETEIGYIVTKLTAHGFVQTFDELLEDWFTLQPGDMFTQHELNTGKVRYVHQDEHSKTTDFMTFDVRNANGNKLLDQTFVIRIVEDSQPPSLSTNKALTLKEGASAIISATQLSATDKEIGSLDVEFNVVDGPMHGILELKTKPGIAIHKWKQIDLERGLIVYNNLERPVSNKDQFHFILSDGRNEIDSVFNIHILESDDEVPVLNVHDFQIQSGTRKTITHYEISAEDPDTADNQISFIVKKQPARGHFELLTNGSYFNTQNFTLENIQESRVSYIGRGNALQDSFSIIVTDTVNKGYKIGGHLRHSPTLVTITLTPVTHGTPLITVNNGISYLDLNNGKPQNVISSDDLFTIDKESSSKSIRYNITGGLRYGYLRFKKSHKRIKSFTQEDINKGVLYYQLAKVPYQSTIDNFTFDVIDLDKNIVKNNIFHIEWSQVYMGQRHYSVKETDNVVKILVRRNGNLKRRSRVHCQAHSGTALGRRGVVKRRKVPVVEPDFVPLTMVAEFDVGESEQFCEIRIIDDESIEGKQQFIVKLVDSRSSVIGRPKKSLVVISDEEDKPRFSFISNLYSVSPKQESLGILIRRTGDLSLKNSVKCVTRLSGKNSSQILHNSTIYFLPGVNSSSCLIRNEAETKFFAKKVFNVTLIYSPEGSRPIEMSSTLIETSGLRRKPSLVRFKQSSYKVVESTTKLRLTLERFGQDLSQRSSVWLASREISHDEAKSGIDFKPFSTQIFFEVHQKEVTFVVKIFDDATNPKLEGTEMFEVFLSTPHNALLDPESSVATVSIIDDEDISTVEFLVPKITALENQTFVRAWIYRSGDITTSMQVYCITEPESAKPNSDYVERGQNLISLLRIPIGVRKIECEVEIIDDIIYEKEETFRLKLLVVSPNDNNLGPNSAVTITIQDPEDHPKISFEQALYSFSEPNSETAKQHVNISLLRIGDATLDSKVHLSSRNGTAFSGLHYEQYDQKLHFRPAVTRINATISLLHHEENNWDKSFRVILGPDDPINAELGSIISAEINILDHLVSESSVFPFPPVVSSRKNHSSSVSPGFPLTCITSCEESHPQYESVKDLCTAADLTDSMKVKYSWELAVPTHQEHSLTPFHFISDSTLFANGSSKILDPMFFRNHFRVRCIAQPVLDDNYLGIPLRSKPVEVSSVLGLCNSHLNSLETFVATISYVNFTDSLHPNTIRVDIHIPHRDGMVPLISTLPIHNIKYLLTDKLYRSHHICSNLVGDGFVPSEQRNPSTKHIYENLQSVEDKTLQLYTNLHLESCAWKMTAWFTMSDLVDKCGGMIQSDFQVDSGGKSFVTVKLPLFISYIFATSSPGWTSMDHRTELSVSMYYDTLLLNRGLNTKPSLTGKTQISRIFLDHRGRLLIEFTTWASFRGRFVLKSHNGSNRISKIATPSNLNLDLELIWSAQTWDGPEQVWRASSNFSADDYSGNYTLQLVPCMVSPSQEYVHTIPPSCAPQQPINFTLQIEIQQIQRPIPLAYTLNTDFHLLRDRQKFLEPPGIIAKGYRHGGHFRRGESVYGKVLWHPQQPFHPSLQLTIEKVYICSGKNGFVPKYDPDGDLYGKGAHYGCIKKSDNLLHQFVLLDRSNETILRKLKYMNARFAADDSEFKKIHEYAGVDGFIFDVDGLYDINSGYLWFLQVLYTIGLKDIRNKREYQSLFSVTTPIPDMSENASQELPVSSKLQGFHTGNGTNLLSLSLANESSGFITKTVSASPSSHALYIASSVVLIFLLVLIIVFFGRRHYLRNKEKVVVKSMKNELHARRQEDQRDLRLLRPTTPVTLNSESNLQTIKVKTLAVTVRNNLEEQGTEV